MSVFISIIAASFVAPHAVPSSVEARALAPRALHATQELPVMYRERWANEEATDVPQANGNVANRDAAARLSGALLGASAFALIGASLSGASTDESIRMLVHTGLMNDQVLFTDTLMRGLDTANIVGLAALPLAAFYVFLVTPSDELSAIEADFDAEACLIADVEEPICGRASFDSTDDMMCVEHYVDGNFRWVCA